MPSPRPSPVVLAAAALALALAAPGAVGQETLVTYSDIATFLDATCALSAGEFPPVGTSVAPIVVGDLTIQHVAPATDLIVTDWLDALEGLDLGVSGVENLSVAIAGSPVTSFGFEFFEPLTPAGAGTPNCNFPTCLDSVFEITLSLGGAPVATLTFDPPTDTTTFFGVWSEAPFDQVDVRELTDDVGNEYFGNFFVGDCTPSFVYGDATAGTGGFVPQLPPPLPLLKLGGATHLVASDLLGGAPALLAVGLEPQDAFVKGIHLLVLPDFYLPLPVGGAPGVAGDGGFTLPLSAPVDPLLADLTLYLQVIVQDDGGPGFGYAASRGLTLTICP